MATVNKNFRVKNGLVVEGTTATVNGHDVLTKASADQNYIIDLIGGTATSANTANTVVKRDASGNFSAGTITATFSGNLTGNVTGDVTGTVSSLSNHDTDDLAEGSNQYFTDARAKTSAADLLTNANLTNITITGTGAGLTITAENGVADSDTDDLAEGTSNLYFTNTRARQAVSGGTGISYDNSTGVISVDNTIATKTYADNAASDAVNNATTDSIDEGSSNLYFTNGRARNAVSAGTGITYNAADGIINVTSGTYDAYGAASSAEAAANSYTDTEISSALTTAQGYANTAQTNAESFATTAAGNAQSAAESYADNAISALNLAGTYDALGSAASALSDANAYTDAEVAALVAGAPALLDTLNELAAAIADNPNYATDVANLVASKADTSYVDSEISDLDTAAQGYASTAQTNAQSYADGLAANYDVAGAASTAQTNAQNYADGLVDDVLDGTTDFTALDVNSVSRQIAATTGNIVTAAATTAISWAKSDYRTAKILVKAKNGSHTHVSEVIITLDTSDNIALNEYAITTTNGSLMAIDADINSGNVRLVVTPQNNNTEVMAHATLLA